MSKLSKKSKVAIALAGAIAFAGTNLVSADTLKDLQKADSAIHKTSTKSQVKVDKLYDQAQNLVFDYRQVVDDTDNTRAYNDYIQTLVDDQEAKIASIQSDIAGIDKTRQGLVPLMFKMIDTLEQFVALDLPFEKEERSDRVGRLRGLMVDSNVSTAEKYRMVLEAYQIEMEAGRSSNVYQGKETIEGSELSVDVLQFGRIALVAQTLDSKRSWVWNKANQGWESLDDSWRRPIRTAIEVVRKDRSPELIKLPISAVGSAK